MRSTSSKFTSSVFWIATCALAVSTATEACAQDVELSYGVDITTNYLAKGFTQTDDGPALQGWAEVGFGLAYFGLFTSNASFGGPSDVELDVGFGFRPSFGQLDLDFGYVQYLYRDDKTDYGEAFLFATYNFSDTSFARLKYYREVFFDYDTVYIEGGTSDIGWGLSLSAGIGSDFGTRGLSQDAVYADIGLTKELSDNAAFDLRAHYSAFEGNRLVATVSFYN